MKEIIGSQKNRIVFLIFLLVITVYANSLNNSFVWDDKALVTKNSLIKNWHNLPKFFTTHLYYGSGHNSDFYRPFQQLSLFLDYSVWGLNPLGFHITNIILHALNAVLIYLFLELLFKRREIPLISALLFAIHPIHTQAVTYIAGRADLLALGFLLLAMLMFIKYRACENEKNKWYYLGTIVFFVFALLSRESAVVFPFLLLLYGVSFRREWVSPAKFKSNFCGYIPFFLLLSIYIALRLTILDFMPLGSGLLGGRTNLYLRAITFPRIVFTYIRLLFFPLNLHMQYSTDFAVSFFRLPVFVSNVLLIFLLFAVVWLYKKSKLFFFAIAWFFLALLPHSNIIPLNAVVAEHWLYVPSIGFFILFSAGLVRLSELTTDNPAVRRKILIFILVPILGTYSVLTVKRNTCWKDELTIYKDTLKYSPFNVRVRNNLGLVYKNMGEYEKAVKEFEKAIKLKHDYVRGYHNLGVVYFEQKKYEQAIGYYNKAIEIDPGYADSYASLGGVYFLQKRYDEAIQECRKAITLRENNAEAYNNLGAVYSSRNEYNKATECFERAIEINPDFVTSYNNLIEIYLPQKQYSEAVRTCKKALNLKEGLEKTHNSLGVAYSHLSKYKQAAEHYKKAIDINSNYSDPYKNLGAVYNTVGQYTSAIEMLEKAVELDPDCVEVHNNLGIAYKNTEKYEKAIDEYKKALQLQPSYVKAYNNLGVVYDVLGEKKKAIQQYRKALVIDEDMPQACYNLGKIYLEQKKYSLAREFLQKAKDSGLDVSEYWERLPSVNTYTK